jgi:complex iron-sulfur molybdoenzyme family reductase subunit gamma
MISRYLSLSALLLILGACSEPPDLTPLDSSGGVIVAEKIFMGEVPLDPNDQRWDKIASREVLLYPQRSVFPAVSQQVGVQRVKIQALRNGSELGLRLEWADDTPANKHDIGQFVDAVALEWPVNYGSGVNLPYVGMGDAEHPVALWLWQADDSAETLDTEETPGTAQTLAAKGFGSLTTQPSDGVTAKGVWNDGVWQVVIKRSLEVDSEVAGEHNVLFDPDEQGLIPVAVAIWNGEQGQRGGRKQLSAWRVVYLEDGDVDPAYVQQLAIPTVQGNAETGKQLMSGKGCIACHAYPDNLAQPTLGPGLRYAGGIHRTDYLLESLVEPSKVVIPGKGFYTVQNGQHVSLMPPFQGTEQERDDIVAYLKTLQ